jgi:hypothetical protein
MKTIVTSILALVLLTGAYCDCQNPAACEQQRLEPVTLITYQLTSQSWYVVDTELEVCWLSHGEFRMLLPDPACQKLLVRAKKVEKEPAK